MLTVRASKKRFFLRRDVRLTQRPRAGTRAHNSTRKRAKKILSNETNNSSRSFYRRVPIPARVFYSADTTKTNERDDDRFRSVSLGVCVFSRYVGFSLAENPRDLEV